MHIFLIHIYTYICTDTHLTVASCPGDRDWSCGPPPTRPAAKHTRVNT